MENIAAAKILLVDDEPYNIKLLERLLNSDYETYSVSSGAEALSAIQTEEFDLVLLDVMMPGMSGLDVLRVVRDVKSPQELPIILVTALTDSSDIQKGLALHANDYITKPFDIDETRSRVQTQLYVKGMADAQKKAMAELEKANELRQRMLRIASHDLKNPLNNLGLILGFIEQQVAGNGEAQDMIELGRESLNSMYAIIQEFLDLEVVQGSDICIDLLPIDLDFAVAEVIVQFQNACDAKQIKIEMDYSDTTVIADRRRLTQVLSNLISNAVKYSPSGSNVQIYTRTDANDVTLHVIDQGTGIPVAEQCKLFQPFGQTSVKPTAGEQSTGLGLWIVKQMMDAQGGEVGLSNSQEGGADFWIRLPKAGERVMAIA